MSGLLSWLKRFKHPSNPIAGSYHQGPVYNNGALEFVYNQALQYPVMLYRGAGRLAGGLRPLEGPQLRYLKSAPQSGLGGNQAGYLYSQPLLDQEPSVGGDHQS